MKTKLIILFSVFLVLSACGPNVVDVKEKAISDSIANLNRIKIKQDSIESINKENDIEYVNLISIADSLFFVKDFKNAKLNYIKTLGFTDNDNNIKIINSKIDNCERKIEENSPFTKTKKLLLGKHVFGVQFIWDGYGSATIKQENQLLKITGNQFSKDNIEYVKINGTIEIIDEHEISFDGNIKIYTKGCCGVIDKTGKFTFKKKGKRKYWRLQEFNQFCSQYTCAYYLDIFE